jgi:hypothetical protein
MPVDFISNDFRRWPIPIDRAYTRRRDIRPGRRGRKPEGAKTNRFREGNS